MLPRIKNFGSIQTSHGFQGLTPQNITIECVGWNTLQVRWSEIANEKCLIACYGIYYREETANLQSSLSSLPSQIQSHQFTCDWKKVQLTNNDHSFLIKNLKPYVNYAVVVFARSAVKDLETHSKVYHCQCTGGFIVGISSNSIHVYDIIRLFLYIICVPL